MGGLVLDTRAGLSTIAGKTADSRLLLAVRYTDPHLKMPPAGKLPDTTIADFEQWVAMGAPDPRTDSPTASASPTPGRRVVGAKELEEGRKWWAFQPVRIADPAPIVRNATWAARPLDRFVLAKLEEAGLAPSAPADDAMLAKRVYLDLVGLRPTYEQVQAYVNDSDSDKYRKLVESLLGSRQYGERWGRYWLDVARYAEDNVGNITNPPYPHAWRYRDWVIDALNRDVPYDRFIRLQLAADLMPATPRSDLPALGYIGLGNIEHKDGRLSEPVVGGLQLVDMDERVDAVSRGVLGLSVSCARCHDHKFDPLPTRDYHRLLGVFASTQRSTRPLFAMEPQEEQRFQWIYQRLFDLHYTANLLDGDPGSKPEQAKRQVAKFRAEIDALNAEIAGLGKKYPEIPPYMATVRYPGAKGEDKNRNVDEKAPFLNTVYDAGMWIDSSEPDLTLFTYRPGVSRDVPIFRGGNWTTGGEENPRGFLTVLQPAGSPESRFGAGSGRLELADRIFGDAQALTARVIVNRVWGWHFGTPLAATPSDFGIQGQKPTHPELLDDLAARFIANGWSLKWLHREIMVSATYRQSSHPRADAMEKDPANRLLWRITPRRVDIESYRDSLLLAAGKLDPAAGGPSTELDTSTRRTVYARISRTRLDDLLRLYDMSEPVLHSPSRVTTISPAQQLFVLNSAFIQEQAATLAKETATDADPAEQIQSLYRRILSREPTAKEKDLGLTYLAKAGAARYAQALLALNEVIFWP